MDMLRQRSEEHATGGMLAPLTVRAGRSTVAAREKIGLAALAIERARRGTLARMRRSRLLRWRHRAPITDDLLLTPPDVRPQDPSFADEIESGGFGLCGFTVQLRGRSPFAVPPPSETWTRELHGFAWLRHFGAAWSLENETTAQRLVAEWIAGRRRHAAHAWAPEVVSRRIISWLSHAALILNGAERRPYAAVMLSLEDQVTYLSATWRNAPPGYPRLLALIGLAQTGLCIAGHERRLNLAERPLVDELERQILADGGHISRNPWIGAELLLDLLPLRQCFTARGLTPDPALLAAIDRMIPWLHRMRLGDGQLARFNGMGPTERDALATVFAYDKGGHKPAETISPSGYARMERGATVILADAGPPPALELAGHACAGCLSFEMSTGRELLLVNGGMPATAHERRSAAARGTTSHNTLELNGQSSAKLVRSEGLERGVGAAPIQHPDLVTCTVSETDGCITLTASHDGYADRFNLVHSRTLTLDAAGGRLDGIDRLDGAKGDLRFSWDIPFAVHFHLHPRSGARINPDGSALLVLPSGECWRLSASGAALTIEESTHYAEVIWPLQAQQVVLRAACYGAAEVQWVLERLTTQNASQPTSDGAEEPAGAAEASEADEGASAIASAPESGGGPA
jgi:uncharacterized heparinase superfamily protein